MSGFTIVIACAMTLFPSSVEAQRSIDELIRRAAVPFWQCVAQLGPRPGAHAFDVDLVLPSGAAPTILSLQGG